MSTAPRSAAARRDWGSDDSGCGILHVDMDAFFASVELARRPELRGLPVVVAGGERGVTLSATYEARALGIRAAMPVGQARRMAPQAVFIRPHHRGYREESAAVMEILHDMTAIVEQVSVDEAYLDVSGARRRLGSPTTIARRIRERVHRERGLSCSVGVASSKLVAKLASTHAKPDGLMLVPRSSEVAFLHALDVRSISGVGARTAAELSRRGIVTVAQLAQTAPEALEAWLGVHGRQLYDLAWARDHRPVDPSREEKSIGSETTFATDVTDPASVDARLVELADRCASRLRAHDLVARTVGIKVRTADFSTTTRSRTLFSPTDSAGAVLETARALYAGIALRGRAVRLVGVRVEGLAPRSGVGVQVSLDEAVEDRFSDQQAAHAVTDDVRSRFGAAALRPATVIAPGRPTVPAQVRDLS